MTEMTPETPPSPEKLKAVVDAYFWVGLPPKALAKEALLSAAAWEADQALSAMRLTHMNVAERDLAIARAAAGALEKCILPCPRCGGDSTPTWLCRGRCGMRWAPDDAALAEEKEP